jgi:hypothetical protein
VLDKYKGSLFNVSRDVTLGSLQQGADRTKLGYIILPDAQVWRSLCSTAPQRFHANICSQAVQKPMHGAVYSGNDSQRCPSIHVEVSSADA